MKNINNEDGFTVVAVLLAVVALGVAVFAGMRITGSDNDLVTNTQAKDTVAITPADEAILAQAKELKKIDFDLDGLNNNVDNDVDNDGIVNSEDNDNDNDGIDNDVDNDDDNDGINDEDENEEQEAKELSEAVEASEASETGSSN